MKEAGSANRRIARHMDRSDEAIRRCWQERVDNSRFQRHDGSGRPRVTADRVRLAVTAPDSSDKSHFQLCPYNHRKRVWRRLVQQADPAFTTAQNTSIQSEVMVWGAISFESRSFWTSLEQDNAKTHMTRVTMNCLKACQTLFWPASLPDRSPIEHVWKKDDKKATTSAMEC
ncbi:transposable element Tc1 transposase [Trichonephila clavipes]|nr:transposable element Tc1 transposase [Trichonephila clavipes]